jgi:hypothetical protein
MFDFPFDKGVSIGDGVLGTVVSNCLVYACNSGIAVKDECPATIYDCTLVDNTFGINLQAKFPLQFEGGRATNTGNNILWSNAVSIQESNNSRVVVNYSDLQGTNFPGVGNISADPLFLAAAARDYRLATNSPARGTGLNGVDMGARFPVGSMMAPSHSSFESIVVTNGLALVRFWADSERTYTVECSDVIAGGDWTRIADIPTSARPRLLTVTNSLAPDDRFYRLVTPQRP